MDILNAWLDDLPQQFQGKELIEGLISAFAKQLEEIQRVFSELDLQTDLDSAIGKNLDMVGDIVTLSRKDAHIIIRSAENADITDEVYRKVLRYKAISNSCECTYYDIMDSINLLWDTDNIKYVEPADRPATVLLSMPTVSLDAIDPSVGRVLAIKPAGVGIVYTIGYYTKFNLMNYEKTLFPKMAMHWKFLFYSFAMKNLKTLDGTWPLDGSVLLSAFSIDVPARIKYSGIVAYGDEEISMSNRQRIEIKSPQDIHTPKNIMVLKVNEVRKNIHILDGKWPLDGSRLLDSEVWLLPVRTMLNLGDVFYESYILCDEIVRCFLNYSYKVRSKGITNRFKINGLSEVSEKMILTADAKNSNDISANIITKKNIWYLDGNSLLDGSRYLNAIEKKEVI